MAHFSKRLKHTTVLLSEEKKYLIYKFVQAGLQNTHTSCMSIKAN